MCYASRHEKATVCQLLLARARRQPARVIAEAWGGDDQTVRNAMQAFQARGLTAVQRRASATPLTPQAVFTPARREPLRDLQHQRPQPFGHPPSVWSLEWAAKVADAPGLTPCRVSGETLPQALAQCKTRWTRAQHWITSPDPADVRKKPNAIT
jgi:DNA-binding transcriptional MocR family regulator